MPSCSMVLAMDVAAVARSAGAALLAAIRSCRYEPLPIRAKRALVATESSAIGSLMFGLCMWVLMTTAFRALVKAEQTFAFASPPCWATEALVWAGRKYASAARATAITASASAAYVSHREASDERGKGTGFSE